ncbi:sugar phosphate isomerase/epimerase [Blastopirellula sp. J2-11]|uniref:sugar phosphate isomerase/epimerase family protein n=1 Tax=Blastopirellula sp. J2-11 TaxID=2943192 RepID=UPI0021C74FED|nr:sugar phosphate isomerase/epimerase [Blastopirellula sp. J2-11]UUO07728.1 sugar phosphate isomerase/epimerase [Blastopirellula sp. J2-11]
MLSSPIDQVRSSSANEPLRLSRRQVLQGAAAAILIASPAASPAQAPSQDGCTLGFSTYGMKTLQTEDAIQAVAKIGFDAIEIAVRPDWDSAPGKMPAKRRQRVRQLLAENQLQLTSLMEHLEPSRDEKERQSQLDRLQGVFELAEDWRIDQKPLVQTTLGGGNWNELREFYRDRIGQWVELAEQHDVVIAVKPHRGGGMSRPSEAVWLIQQLGNPRCLRMVYDYSHYAFREMPLDETVQTALPYTAHIALKDAMQQGKNVAFQLPGKSDNVDFSRIFRLFYAGGYRGDLNCEVSGMVWGKPGYDPIESAKLCYASMSKAMQTAEVPRA